MRALVAVAVLSTSLAVAQDADPFLKGDELQAAIKRDCAEGCVTFNRQEAEEFREAIKAEVARHRQEAFEAGMSAQKQACRSLI